MQLETMIRKHDDIDEGYHVENIVINVKYRKTNVHYQTGYQSVMLPFVIKSE